jgi:DNA adenine methylase
MLGPFAYIGGKRAIAKQIISVFPEHTTYIEAFAGGAQVLFRKEPSKVEVLNDLDGEIVNFFRVCQLHYEELLRYLHYMVASRKWFELLREIDPRMLTDIQRAARLFYLQKNSYAGLILRPNFRWSATQPPGFNPERIPELIEETHRRLSRVQIECLPYEKVLAQYDSPSSLSYLDPPYFGRHLYKFNLEADDFRKMAELLAKVRGKFVLSLNDLPEVRAIFKGFKFRDIDLAYTAQKVAGRRYRELLIANF